MKTSLPEVILAVIVVLAIGSTHAQQSVGINTLLPAGALDINSTTYGMVFPQVALSATNVSGSIVNPNGGGAPINGTVVYNTNTTSSGSNDVAPGKYYWKDGEWIPMFERKQSELFVQDRTPGASPPVDGFAQRVSADGTNVTFENIKGLTNRTFIPEYTGTYKIRAIVNYGIGFSRTRNLNFAQGRGDFKLSINTTDYILNVKSYAGRNTQLAPNTNFFAIYTEPTILEYINLTAGVSYNINLSFDQYFSPEIENNANSLNGRGLVGVLNPCYVEISFIK